jgi:hypothetical protein
MEEEHGGQEGAFAEFDKVNKAEVSRALKELRQATLPGASAPPARPAPLAASDLADVSDLKRRLRDGAFAPPHRVGATQVRLKR